MQALGAMIAFFLFLAVVYLILRPFLVPEPIVDDDLATIQLDIQKDRIIEAIREIDMDFETGKLSDDDYNLLRSRYTAAAGEIIRRIDSDAVAHAQSEREDQTPPVHDAETDDGVDDDLDDELERQIAERKSAMKEAR